MSDRPKKRIGAMIRTFVQSRGDRQKRRTLERDLELLVQRARVLGDPDLANLVWVAGLHWANDNTREAHRALIAIARGKVAEQLHPNGGSDRVPRLR